MDDSKEAPAKQQIDTKNSFYICLISTELDPEIIIMNSMEVILNNQTTNSTNLKNILEYYNSSLKENIDKITSSEKINVNKPFVMDQINTMSSEILPKNILGDDFLKYVYCYNNEKDIEERAYTFHIGFFYKNNTSILPLENLIIKNHQSKIENLLLTYMYYIKYTILKGQYVGNILCPDTLQGSNDEFEKIISKTITDAQNNTTSFSRRGQTVRDNIAKILSESIANAVNSSQQNVVNPETNDTTVKKDVNNIVKILSESITRAVNSSQQLVKTNDNSDTESTPSLFGDKNTEAAEAAEKKAEEERIAAEKAAAEKKAEEERIAAEKAAAEKKAEEERIAAEKKKAEEEKAAAAAEKKAEEERIAADIKTFIDLYINNPEKYNTKHIKDIINENIENILKIIQDTDKKNLFNELYDEFNSTLNPENKDTKTLTGIIYKIDQYYNENKDRPVDVNGVQIKMRKEESEEEEKSKFKTINDELFKFDVKVLTDNVYQDGGKEMITELENLEKRINNVQNQTKKMNLLKHYYSVFLDFNGILLMKKIIQYIDKNNNKDDEREIIRKNEINKIIEIQKKLDNIFVEIQNKTLQIQTISTNESEKDESKEITEGKIHVFLDKMFLLELFLILSNIKNKKVIGSIGYFIETNDKITIPFVKITISELIESINKYNINLDKKQSYINV